MIKLLIYLALAGGLAYCGATVKLGKRTFFGHVRAIWATEEVQDLKNGVQEKAGPAARDLKNKVHELTSDDPAPAGSGSGSAGSGSAGSAAPAHP
ncbi:MAG: hypothetical protein IPQ07_14755 [Myxococcales bacterium]|nr:hypothetical protein [Myxococcales bacterium]